MAENNERPRVDRLFDVLSDHRRRQLCAYMHSSDEDVFDLDHIVQMIVSQENESSEISDKLRERVKIDLHHRHLPKLDDAGLVEYDPRNSDVRYRGTTDSDITDVSKLLNSTEESVDSTDQ